MILLPIHLSKDFSPIVAKGQKISVGEIIAQKKDISKDDIIHLGDFGISPQSLKSSLKKNLGDKVQIGDSVAVKKKIFGGKKILSSVNGTISKIDEQNCNLYIKVESVVEVKPLISPVEGIVEICNNEQIVIKTAKNAISVKDALGKDAIGQLLYIKTLPLGLNESIEGKIIANEILDKVSLYKALGLGAIGIIAVELKELDFIEIQERDINAAIMLIDKEEFKKLEKINGKKVLCDVKGKAILIL